MKYAVAVMNFFDNDLVVNIIEATSIKEAIIKHSLFNKQNFEDKTREEIVHLQNEWIMKMPDDLSLIKDEFANADWLIDVVQVDA